MWGQQFTSLLLVLGFTSLSNALPGFHAHACRDKINGVDIDPCSNIFPTTSDPATTASRSNIPSSITSGPSIVVQNHRRTAQSMTVICDIHECSFYDVSSSLVTVVTLPAVTAGPQPPFGNGTETPRPHPGPTGSGTVIISRTGVSGISSEELNGTTTITSRTTVEITVTAGNWSDWTSAAAGTGTGTGRPHNSANATNSHNPVSASHWSVTPGWSTWPTPTETSHASSTFTNSTYLSAGRTHTGTAHSSSRSSCSSGVSSCSVGTTSISYITTETYVFSGLTVVLPIPDSFESSRTSHSTTTPTSKHTSKHTSSTTFSHSLVGGSISTSSCWTTTDKSTTVTGDKKHTIMAGASQICWILSCDEDDHCTDHISRYPVTVDAISTSSMSHGNTSVMATTTTSSHGTESATMTSNPGHETTWMTWSAGVNSTTMSSSSHSRSTSSVRSTTRAGTRSVDATSRSPSTSAFESTYPSWASWTSTMDTMTTPSFTSDDPIAHPSISVEGTMTRTVSPMPAGTSEAAMHAGSAMMKRKRYLMDHKREGVLGKGFDGEVEEMEKGDM